MRRLVTTLLVALPFAACATSTGSSKNDEFADFAAPNQIVQEAIDERIAQIPWQHREELLQNLLWLAQSGEQAIPAVVKGLDHDTPKVRSSCAWVLSRMGDRRVISSLQSKQRDSDPTVRMEIARTLVLMGDLKPASTLIEGLDSEKKEVRFLCSEALKSSTGRDFGYDHLADGVGARQPSIYQWRTWYADMSGDAFFATNYAQEHGLVPTGEATPMVVDPSMGAAPAGETAPVMPMDENSSNDGTMEKMENVEEPTQVEPVEYPGSQPVVPDNV